MEKYLDKIIDGLVSFGGKLLLACIIILVGFKLVNFVMKRLHKGIGFNKLEKTSQTFISSIVSIALKTIVIITAVTTMGIPMTTVITIVGSAGLALGLALQGGLSNIAGGVMIMIFKPFKVGDFIDTHTDCGTVKAITNLIPISTSPSNNFCNIFSILFTSI